MEARSGLEIQDGALEWLLFLEVKVFSFWEVNAVGRNI